MDVDKQNALIGARRGLDDYEEWLFIKMLMIRSTVNNIARHDPGISESDLSTLFHVLLDRNIGMCWDLLEDKRVGGANNG